MLILLALEHEDSSKPTQQNRGQIIMRFFEGDEVVSLGPDGPKVTTIKVATTDLSRELGKMLHALSVDEGIAASDIVVLTPRSVASSEASGKAGRFNLIEEPKTQRMCASRASIGSRGWTLKPSSFARYAEDADLRRLMYVACSRARTLLSILFETT